MNGHTLLVYLYPYVKVIVQLIKNYSLVASGCIEQSPPLNFTHYPVFNIMLVFMHYERENIQCVCSNPKRKTRFGEILPFSVKHIIPALGHLLRTPHALVR